MENENKNYVRGEIYYIYKAAYTGSEQIGGRPAIIVSNNLNNKHSEVVTVIYLTTQPKKDLPTHVAVKSATFSSTALCEQIATISKERIGNYVGTCSAEEMTAIDKALAIALGLSEVNPKDYSDEDSQTRIIRLEAERNVYKELCDKLMNRAG